MSRPDSCLTLGDPGPEWGPDHWRQHDAGSEVVNGLYADMATNVFKLRFAGTQGTAPTNHEGRGGWRLSSLNAGSASAASPMTNAAGAFDFNYYLTNNGITLLSNDWVLVNLGINDMFSWRRSCAPTPGRTWWWCRSMPRLTR